MSAATTPDGGQLVKLRRYFLARPGQRLSGRVLDLKFGLGFRTRISEARRWHGMTITPSYEYRTAKNGQRITLSFYTYTHAAALKKAA